MAIENGQVGTLSEPDKVTDAVVPAWTKFADLSIDQKFEQARLMDFEVRDAYLRERCRAAKMEVACAASALDRATAIIEANLPFFVVHFQEMDRQGHRSDLKGKIVGKTEWLRQNVPNISKGTFYAAFNSVKARYAEQERLMLGGEVPLPTQPSRSLTETQKAVVQALDARRANNSTPARSAIIPRCAGATDCRGESSLSKSISTAARGMKSGLRATTSLPPNLSR